MPHEIHVQFVLKYVLLLSDIIIIRAYQIYTLPIPGGHAVQVISALYQHSPKYLETLLQVIREWMTRKNFEKIDDFRGLFSQERQVNPA